MEYAAPGPAAAAPSRALVTPAAQAWATAASGHVDRACVSLLWLEMAPVLAAGAAHRARRANELAEQLRRQDPGAHVPPALSKQDEAAMAQDRARALGRHVGAALTERLLQGRARLPTALDAVKFVCKEVWLAVYEKQMDNLRTNHRVRARALTQGVFVLQDYQWRPLAALSAADASHAYTQMVRRRPSRSTSRTPPASCTAHSSASATPPASRRTPRRSPAACFTCASLRRRRLQYTSPCRCRSRCPRPGRRRSRWTRRRPADARCRPRRGRRPSAPRRSWTGRRCSTPR